MMSIQTAHAAKPIFYGRIKSCAQGIAWEPGLQRRHWLIKGLYSRCLPRSRLIDSFGETSRLPEVQYGAFLQVIETWMIGSSKQLQRQCLYSGARDDQSSVRICWHRAWSYLNNDAHGKMILPLLNLKDAHMFWFQPTIPWFMSEKYGVNHGSRAQCLQKPNR